MFLRCCAARISSLTGIYTCLLAHLPVLFNPPTLLKPVTELITPRGLPALAMPEAELASAASGLQLVEHLLLRSRFADMAPDQAASVRSQLLTTVGEVSSGVTPLWPEGALKAPLQTIRSGSSVTVLEF